MQKDYLEEIEYLKSWCFTVLDFLADRITDYKEIAEVIKKRWEAKDLPNNNKVVKGLREGKKDFCEMANMLENDQYEELDRILRKKFGEGLYDAKNKTYQQIYSIVWRGRIRNNEEFRLLSNYIIENLLSPKQVERINDILSKYEVKK